PETIEIHGLRTITKLCHFGADNNMEGCTFTEIVERLFAELQKAKAQAVPVWISTDFMKPDDNDYVDILINGKRRIVDAVYLDGKFFIFPPFSKEQWTEVNNKVTHWMPRVEVASESGAEG
ncbi:DUF551 domain-containing protein, partial [Acinetobacter baumannii]|uniref:DUF551 domain-containing protein n=2 Tax=Acinetobacter baumannii TaxID=470 RepID=UPI003463804D